MVQLARTTRAPERSSGYDDRAADLRKDVKDRMPIGCVAKLIYGLCLFSRRTDARREKAKWHMGKSERSLRLIVT